MSQKQRTWICTWNNPPEDKDPDALLNSLHVSMKAVYTVGQLEKGENGTIHLQFAVNFKSPQRLAAFKKYNAAIHAEPARRDDDVYGYVQKADTRVAGPWEFGIKPVRRNSKLDWEEVWQKAKVGDIDSIPKELAIKHYRNLQAIHKDHMKQVDAEDLRGVWIYGESGVGKSRTARNENPVFYPKLCNKWWDGYQGEPCVIMDDFGLEHKVLGQQLKIWGDRYGCILETKGGAVPSRFEQFIVTSQYSIDEIWPDDEPTRMAIKRRFKQRHLLPPLEPPPE